MQPLAPTAPPPPVAIPGPAPAAPTTKDAPAPATTPPNVPPAATVTPEPSPASPPAPALAAPPAGPALAPPALPGKAPPPTQPAAAPVAVQGAGKPLPPPSTEPMSDLDGDLDVGELAALDGYQAHEVSRTDDSLSSDTDSYGIIACSEPPRDRRRPGLRAARARPPPPPFPGMVRGGPRRRAASKPPATSAVTQAAARKRSATSKRRPPTYAKSSGTNGAIAIIGAKRMRVIVRDGNGVPIEPPTSTGGRGLDDSSSCASVDERCLDGLLPHGGGARVDPYRARDALRRRGGCGVQALPECAEYRCAACGDEYRKRCGLNPWWALVQHECPRCGRVQFPSINIAAAANAITYLAADDDAADHRAARAAADALALQDAHDDAALLPDLGLDPREATPPLNDDEKPVMVMAGGGNSPQGVATPPPSLATSVVSPPASGAKDAANAAANAALAALGVASVSPEGANGHFPQPKPQAAPQKPVQPCLPDADAKRLFALFDHARYCPGCHKSKKHDDVCTAAKFVMLHVRDCAGHLPDGRPCPFGWCSAARLAIRKHPLPPILDK